MTSTVPPPPIEAQLQALHENLRSELPPIERVAVAVYDHKTDLLKTYVNSTRGGSPLQRYEAKLADVPSLGELAVVGSDRVIQDLSILRDSPARHSKVLVDRFGSSFTRPLFDGGWLRGFLFFDATEKGFFTPSVVQHLRVYADLAGMLLSQSLFPMKVLRSTIRVASEVSQVRDPETGAHLDRMSRYARIVALSVGDREGLSDAFIEHLFLFAPLHDIGKVGVPDDILLKKGRLTTEEFEVMTTHVTKGATMIDRVLADLGLESLGHVEVLRNVVRHHHEAWNGGGYPDGLKGEAIPIEARIVTVADVFDALTSERPYKEAWPTERAFNYIQEHSGTLFDPSCVEALVGAKEQVLSVRQQFQEDYDGVHREGYDPDL